MWTWFLCDLEVACARAGLQRPPRRVSVLSARARSQSRCVERSVRGGPTWGATDAEMVVCRRLVRDPTPSPHDSRQTVQQQQSRRDLWLIFR